MGAGIVARRGRGGDSPTNMRRFERHGFARRTASIARAGREARRHDSHAARRRSFADPASRRAAMLIGGGTAAIVTGGASGLGRASAEALAAAGAKVTILDIDETQGREVATVIGGR